MIELKEHNIPTYRRLCEEMENHFKVALVQATGTGKSYIISKYIEEHNLNALILVPANAIGEQWQKLLPNVTIRTYQAMANGIEGKYDLIVADEMHHLGSEVWGKKFTELFMQNPTLKVIGATATEVRYLDNSRDMAEEIFNGIAVRGVDLATAINDGVLPTFKYVTAYHGSEQDFDEYREKINTITDEKQRKDLSRRLEMCIQNKTSIKTAMYENLSMANHKIIVFLNGLCEIDKAVEMFTEMFPNCECNYVSSSRPSRENKNSIALFQQSENQISVLFAVDMLNEGVHIKGADTVVMFRNTESPQVYFQQMGRVLDSNGGLARVIFDFVCNAKSIKENIGSSGETNIIHNINKKIRDKRKKIIIKSYIEELEDLFQQIQHLMGRSRLSEEQEKFLVQNADKYTAPEISKITGINTVTIRAYCKRKGLSLKKSVVCLTDSQKNFLLENREKAYAELAKEIGCSASTVSCFLKKHGDEKRGSSIAWSEDEKAVLYENKDSTYAELSELLPGRSAIAIAEMVRKLGLRNNKELKKDEIVEQYKKGKSIKSIADAMHTTIMYVRSVLIKQGMIEKQSKSGKRINQIDNATGKVVASYKNASEAAKINGYRSPSKLNYAACNNTIAYGYKWKYVE